MIVVALVVSLLIGFVVAAGVIGREARRLGRQRREPVWRLEEAALFAEEVLPVEVASSLDPVTLRDLLRWNHTQLLFEHTGGDADSAEAAVAADDGSTAALYRRVRREGVEVTKPVVDAVVAAHLQYLARIGALGLADAG